MKPKELDREFSVCKVEDYSLVDLSAEYSFIGKTDEENSLVCATGDVPSNVVERDDGWRGFRIQGMLDFPLIGILAGIAETLAGNGISIFAISTYNTDYVSEWLNPPRRFKRTKKRCRPASTPLKRTHFLSYNPHSRLSRHSGKR